jgi:hypothetical protein
MLTISILAGLVGTSLSNPNPLIGPAPIFESGPGPPPGLYFDHIVVVMMENEGIREICGSMLPCNGPYTPYLSSLANQYGIAQQYTSLITTSEPNYFGVLQASISPCPSNCYPSAGGINAANLVDRFYGSGISWRGYFENQNKVLGCDGTTHEPYEHEHNGFTAFQDIFFNNTRCLNTVLANPSSNSTCTVTDCALIKDLNSTSAPNFMWLTPNDCNNMHADAICTVKNGYNGCTVGDSSTCKTDGDNYLASLVPNILNTRTFTTTRAALFIVFDEGVGSGCPYNNSSEDCVYAVWAGPVAKTSFHSGTHYNGYSLTKTLEVNWNLTALTSNDQNATPMSEFFKSDFSLTSNPAIVTVPAGTTPNSTITLSSINGFTGTVTLSANSSPSGLATTLTPSTATVPLGGTATSTLSITTSTSANYTVTVSGTSGTISHNATITVVVQDFQITANPSSLKPNRGAPATSTITISPLNHFTGTFNLIATGTTGLNTSITPPTINLGSGTATLTAFSATAGNYTGIVTASSNALTHSVMINIQVVDFTVGASQPSPARVGTSTSSNITIASINHFTGLVSLSDTVPSALTCTPIIPSTISPTGTATLACTSTRTGNYLLTITATSGTLTHSTVLTFTFQDYTVTATTGQITSPVGTNATTAITAAGINGFNGNVTLLAHQTCTNCSTGSQGGSVREPLRLIGPAPQLSFTFTPSTIILSGASGQSNLTITIPLGLTSGNYMINVTAFDGTNTHSTLISLTVTDYSLTIPNTSLTISPGQNSTQTITLQSLNGFQGNLTLSANVNPAGPTAALNPSTIALAANAKLSILTITVPLNTLLGNYTITIQAQSGTITHTLILTVQVSNGSTTIFARTLNDHAILPLAVLTAGLTIILAAFQADSHHVTFRNRRPQDGNARSVHADSRRITGYQVVMLGPLWICVSSNE